MIFKCFYDQIFIKSLMYHIWYSHFSMIFQKKKWCMENQVNLNCFSPVSVNIEISIYKLFLHLLSKISCQKKKLKVDTYSKRPFTC